MIERMEQLTAPPTGLASGPLGAVQVADRDYPARVIRSFAPWAILVVLLMLGALWIVAAVSAWNTRLRPSVEHRPEWNAVDALVAIVAAGAVRVLVPGIIVLP